MEQIKHKLSFKKDMFVFSLGIGLVWLLAPIFIPQPFGIGLALGCLIGAASFVFYSKVMSGKHRASYLLTLFFTLIPFDLLSVLAKMEISSIAGLHFFGDILIWIVLHKLLSPFSKEKDKQGME